MTKSIMTLDTFEHRVLPLLEKQHGAGRPLARAVRDLLSHIDVHDDAGRPIDIDARLLERDVDRGDADATPDAGADRHEESKAVGSGARLPDDATVSRLVTQALDRMAKARPGSSAGGSGGSARPSYPGGATAGRDARGFASLGEFALAVHQASGQGATVDPRLIHKAPTAFAHESAGEAGGFLVPEAWADRIWEVVTGETSLLSRTTQIPTSRNSLSLPVNETTPWGASGVQAYWSDEGAGLTASRPAFAYRTLRLHKLAALVPASDELLEDAPALDAFIAREAARAIRHKADDAILRGDGVGKPLGLLHSEALVTVPAEDDQAPASLVAQNVARMYSRMPAGSISQAVWLVNQDVLPHLLTMTLGSQPVYLPPTGFSAAPFGTLLGRPILPSPHCPSIGQVGDILFVDLSQYLTLIRRGGIQTAASVHLWFDHDLTAFRFTFRIAGQPWMNAAITPDHGGQALSPMVALAERDG